MLDKHSEGIERRREPAPTSGYISAAEAARKTGLSYAGVLAAIYSGRIPGVKKVGRVWRVPDPPVVTGRRRRLNAWEFEKIAQLAEAGMPKKKIAQQLGLREREVYRVLQRQRERRGKS
jgi:hypothetical protein